MSPESFKVCALGKLPPRHVVPVIFVPGIMGTNLCGNDKTTKPGEPAWRPPNGKMAGLGEWFRRLHQSPAARQLQIGPERVKVDTSGKVSIPRYLFTMTNDEAKRRGWGEVHFDSYGGILAELELALNEPYIEPELPSDGQKPQEVWQVAQTLERVVKDKKIDVRKEWNAQDATIEPLASEEFSRLTDYYYPVWACGYNWLASNDASADQLIQRINEAVAYYKRGSYWISTGKVIIVTHSMGGLVARRAAQKLSGAASTSTGGDGDVGGPEKADDSTEAGVKPQNSGSASGESSSSVVGDAGPDTVLGVVHGVQPVGGAPVVYRRFRAGTEVNGTFNIEAALVAEIMGWSAADIVCVMGNSSGPLELLPTKNYAAGWLKFARYANGKKSDAMPALPVSNPYSEIYATTVKDVWWGM
ncbi:PGAP1-like protein, putative, partial [Medicago truncatula]